MSDWKNCPKCQCMNLNRDTCVDCGRELSDVDAEQPKSAATAEAKGGSLERVVSCVGSQPPEGYIQWHTWAEIQASAGLRQKRCSRCGKWRFPQELSALEETNTGTTGKYGGKVITITGKVCNECAANNQAQRPAGHNQGT